MKAPFRLAIMSAVALAGVSGMALQSGAQQRPPEDRPGHAGRMPPMSADDHAAFLDARLAALRVGLRLTADQEKLWPAMEAAARERAKSMMDLHQKEQNAGPPANPVDGLRRHGEADMARGAMAVKLAEAAQPLWASLSDEQKRRMPMLARGILGEGWRGHGPRADRRPPTDRHEHGMGHDAPGPRDDRAPPPGPGR